MSFERTKTMPNAVKTKISPPTPPPFPIPSSKSVIHLPADHYLHPTAQTEWWWHVGTLKAGHRTFGFEINAAAFYLNKVMFTQVMLTDVDNKVHYRQSTPRAVNAAWAEADPKKNWWVKQGDPATDSAWVTMNAPQADPSKNMVVKAAMVDEVSGKPIKFDLTFSQEGPPFIVWGTGVTAGNYYYSLTRLNASGTVTIADEALRVHGLTWMDHEYGQFGTPGAPVLWFLQDMQLDNGVHLSNFTVFTKPPSLDSTTDSNVTVQFPDGTTYYEQSKLTPFGRIWKSPQGTKFFLEFKIEIPAFHAALVVTSPVDGQDFPLPLLKADTYEGVATARGTFMGHPTHGTAWNEQQPAG